MEMFINAVSNLMPLDPDLIWHVSNQIPNTGKGNSSVQIIS